MNLRLVLSSILFLALVLALAANPCFAKDSHAHRASTTTTATGGKGTTGANQPPNKANVPIDAGEVIAPPVLPSHGLTQRPVRITNPSAKTLVNAPHSQAGVTTNTAPAARNAIGQPVIAPKNFVGAQSGVSPAQQTSRVASRPLLSPGSARVNFATATNHGSINGTTAIRPAIAPSGIGGPAQPRYGINGTTVQSRH